MKKLLCKLKVCWILLKAPDSVMIKFLELMPECYSDKIISKSEKTKTCENCFYSKIGWNDITGLSCIAPVSFNYEKEVNKKDSCKYCRTEMSK